MLYVPQHLPPASPMIVVLHGATQNARRYAAGAGWLALADRFGFAVLCPEQDKKNNPCLAFNWFEPEDFAREGGEAASIRQMVETASAMHSLDHERIFITGLSAGGAMTSVMLATYPDVFRAGAIIAGLPYGVARGAFEAWSALYWGSYRTNREWGDQVRAAVSNDGQWPSIAVWHGEHDRTVRPGAGDDLVNQWLNVHGLDGSSFERRLTPQRSHHLWRSATGEPKVELHRIAGMAHGTPLSTKGRDGCGQSGDYLLEVGISSSREIARSWGLDATRFKGERCRKGTARALGRGPAQACSF